MGARKDIVDAFIVAIQERPEDFSIGEHCLTDKRTGLTFWIANGFWFYGIYQPYEMNFGPVQGFRFGRWVRKFKSARASHALRTGDTP